MREPEFTGERYVPGQGGSQMAYEHLHRYSFAARWARGNDVLDVATGVGYGAALLAETARRVWAVDLEAAALDYARKTHERQNLCFARSDCRRLPFASRSMGLVVAMEILEHILDQEGMLREIARVMRPDGLLLISTPNKASYTDARHYSNPFHVRELYRDEFVELLGKYFPHVQLMRQKVRAGSLIESEGSARSADEILCWPAAGEEKPTEALYYIALCGDREFSPLPPAASVCIDPTDSLLVENERQLLRANAETDRLNEEISKLGQWARRLEGDLDEKDAVLARVLAEVGMRDDTIRELQQEVRREVETRDDTIRRLQCELEERTRWAMDLQANLDQRDKTIAETSGELRRVSDHLIRIRHAFLYRVLCRLKVLPD